MASGRNDRGKRDRFVGETKGGVEPVLQAVNLVLKGGGNTPKE